MKKIKSFIYNTNYVGKIMFMLVFSLILSLWDDIFEYYLIYITVEDSVEYHFNIITINSILSGFSLTNLGILISISSDQLIKKLEGTDILIKRNVLISYSIIYGAISILISLFFVLDLHLVIKGVPISFIGDFFFTAEIIALILSVVYFLLSLRKMIQLLSYIYIPKRKYTAAKISLIKSQMDNSIKEKTDED